MRTHFTQLPNSKELKEILQAEANREVPKEKQNSHYIDVSPINSLIKTFGVSDSFFSRKLTPADLDDNSLFENATETLNALAGAVLAEGEQHQTILNSLYDYLSEEDSLEKADLIFVFGSRQPFRTEKSIELYHQGLAPKIMISGKSTIYDEIHSISEAEQHKKLAISKGVPEDHILIEQNSISMPDNVKSSLNLLEEKGVPFSAVIIVNSPYAQRRGWAYFQKFSPPETKVIRVNARVTELTARDSWYKNEAGVKVILKEFFGMKVSVALNTA